MLQYFTNTPKPMTTIANAMNEALLWVNSLPDNPDITISEIAKSLETWIYTYEKSEEVGDVGPLKKTIASISQKVSDSALVKLKPIKTQHDFFWEKMHEFSDTAQQENINITNFDKEIKTWPKELIDIILIDPKDNQESTRRITRSQTSKQNAPDDMDVAAKIPTFTPQHSPMTPPKPLCVRSNLVAALQ